MSINTIFHVGLYELDHLNSFTRVEFGFLTRPTHFALHRFVEYTDTILIWSNHNNELLRTRALCYAHTGLLSLSMLSRCTHLVIAMAAPPCASSRNVIAMLHQGIRTTRKMSMHAFIFSPSSRDVIAMLHQGIRTSRKMLMHAFIFSPDVSSPRIIGNIGHIKQLIMFIIFSVAKCIMQNVD